ncbi:peptidoglycan/LPS O-acetylase OafA/YrhL [Gibbsiella quercinecans]|nr:peptidoglycan/LPS O-acetylase OafA/YrhL [Gibbsiella quercinecans]
MVVIYHAEIKGEQYQVGSLSSFHIGYFGVDLFFIISGFIMCYTTYNKNIAFTGFMFSRIRRILPLYWLMSFAALFIYLIKPGLVNSSGGVTSIWASFSLIPNGDRYLVSNGWTLSYEFWFYFIFGLALFFPKKYNLFIVGSLILCMMTIGNTVKPDNEFIKFITNNLLFEFLLGVISFYILRCKKLSKGIYLFLILISLLSLLYQNLYGVINNYFGRSFYAGIPMCMLFIGFVGLEKFFISQHTQKVFSFLEMLGNSSYSLYLSHGFVLSPIAIILNKFSITNYSFLFSSILIFSAIVVGWLCYRFLEVPITNKINIYINKQQRRSV